jgi:DNA-binding NarL/FixJ family response regulator
MKSRPKSSPPGAEPPAGRPQILVVEDEWITAQDLRQTLAGFGYRVTAVTPSGAAALDAVAAVRPDLALVDIRLEGAMDGVELAAALRSRHDVPVVYLTAHSDRDTVERLKTTVPHGYVSKPFDEGQLRVAVELALHNAALERRRREEHASDKARMGELETRAGLLEGRLREVAGLVADHAGDRADDNGRAGALGRVRGLSRRELEIVRLLAEGRRVASIARDLVLSVHTVRNHVRAIFRKVDVHSQEELLDLVRGLSPSVLGRRH